MKLQSNYLILAIKSLRPNAQFSIIEDDYENIDWHLLEGNAPTKNEIEAAIELLKQKETEAETKKADAKATAEAKLVALGLTADDLKALGLG